MIKEGVRLGVDVRFRTGGAKEVGGQRRVERWRRSSGRLKGVERAKVFYVRRLELFVGRLESGQEFCRGKELLVRKKFWQGQELELIGSVRENG